jgi:hypothetical protein
MLFQLKKLLEIINLTRFFKSFWILCIDQIIVYNAFYSKIEYWQLLIYKTVLAVDDRHVAFCEYNSSVARIICVAVATLANKFFLERAPDNDLLLCKKSTSNHL